MTKTMELSAFDSLRPASLVVAKAAMAERSLAIVAGKTLCASLVIRQSDEPLFPCSEQRLSRPREIGVAIAATEALRRVRLVVEDDTPLRAAAISQSGQASARFDRSQRPAQPDQRDQRPRRLPWNRMTHPIRRRECRY